MNRLSMRLGIPSSATPPVLPPRGRYSLRAAVCAAVVLGLSLGLQPAFAATESVIYKFAGGTSDGGYPYAGVSIDSSGNLYGTTYAQGTHGLGTAYKLSLSGSTWTESLLYQFGATSDGRSPDSGLILGQNGNFYGTANQGGLVTNYGTFYELTPGTTWTETGQFTFPSGNPGQNPIDYGHVIQDSSGNFYGSTELGGTSNQGLIWEMTLSGAFAVETVLYNFSATASFHDGISPYAGVIMDSSGNIYGTTERGGAGAGCFSAGCGTVFKLTPTGTGTYTETILYSFNVSTDGSAPLCQLFMDASGNLYGTTSAGGASGDGTVFELSPPSSGTAWTFTKLHTFTGSGDGIQPWGGLVMDASGNLWGTTYAGGTHAVGTVYELSPSGGGWSYSVAYSFANGPTDGAHPADTLAIDSSGTIYGTTHDGGSGWGTVFKVTP